MQIELKDEKTNTVIDVIDIDDGLWEALKTKAESLGISEERMLEVIISEYARQVEYE